MIQRPSILSIPSLTISAVALLGACLGGNGDPVPDDGQRCEIEGGPEQDPATRWLAFDSNRGTLDRDIYLVRDDGTEITQLTTETSVEKEPAFSHDGKTLAFASDRSGTMQIYARDLARGGVKQLTSLDAGADQPSWSGDDAQIVFHSGPSIYVMRADGSSPAVLASGEDDFRSYRYPSFSLDENELIFSHGNETFAQNLATGSQRFLVPNWVTIQETPALSPNGRLLAFAVGCTALEVILVTPFSGHTGDPCTAQRMTPPGTGSARRPSWATDTTMAFERSATSDDSLVTAVISVIDGPGAIPRDLVGAPGDNRNPSWAPVGFDPRKICK